MEAGQIDVDQQDRLKRYGEWNFAHSSAGEITVKSSTQGNGETTYKYDNLGRLREVSLPNDSGTVQYGYDAMGRRVSRVRKDNQGFPSLIKPVTRWLYRDGLGIVAEVDGANNVTSRFVYGAGRMPYQMIRNGEACSLVTDYLGSLRAVVRLSDGAIVQRTGYDEFGRVIPGSDVLANGFERVPFGYAGGVHDEETGLTHFGARDYDAETGRWTSKDPVGFAGGDTLLYGYAGGDPVNLVDPSGLDPLTPYGDPSYAALVGLLEAREQGADSNVEGAGVVYTFGDPSAAGATFYHTPASLGEEKSVEQFLAELKFSVPAGATVVAWYHTQPSGALDKNTRWDSWPFSSGDKQDVGIFAKMYLKYGAREGFLALGDGSLWYARVDGDLSAPMCWGVFDGLARY